MSITITVDAGDDPQIRGFVQRRIGAVINSVAEEMSILMLELQAHVVAEHMSGRPGLRQITGTLATSVRAIPTTIADDKISGYVEGGGGPAWYLIVHEPPDGLTTLVPPVSGKLMVFKGADGQPVFTMKHRAFTIPRRPAMKPSIDEMYDEIIGGLRAAVAKGLAS